MKSLYLNLVFMLTAKKVTVCQYWITILVLLKSYLSQQKILVDSMANFDQDFACRSWLGSHANLIEELFITLENFTGLDGEFWSLPLFHKNCLLTIKTETQLHQSSQRFPYIFDVAHCARNKKFGTTGS